MQRAAGCSVVRRGGRVVLLVGVDFRQLLFSCIGEMNAAGHTERSVLNEAASEHVHAGHVCGRHSSDSATPSSVCSAVPVSTVCCTTASDEEETACAVCERYSKAADDAGATTSVPVWTTFAEQYVKLGKTHAYICGFIKNR